MASRGCGTRERGGLYLESAICDKAAHLAGLCKPIDFFVLCSPWPIDRKAMMIPDRGVALIERPGGSGITDVWDYVGSGSYPNVADVIEEGRAMGISRRVPKNGDYSKLDFRSRLILVHERAIASNLAACYKALEDEEREYGAPALGEWHCPKRVIEHAVEKIWRPDPALRPEPPMCGALWYESVTGGEFAKNPKAPPRSVERTIGSTCYHARRWFERGDLVKTESITWEPGAFLMIPIGSFTAIMEKDGSAPKDAIKSAARAALPINIARE